MALTIRRFFRKIPLYPFLFGAYLPLALWLANITQIPPFAVIRPLLISLGVTTAAFLLGWIWTRRWVKAGLVSGLGLTFFFFYGHVFDFVDNLSIGGLVLGRHRFLIPLALLLTAAGSFLVARAKRKTLYPWTSVLNVVSVFLLLLVGVQLLVRQLCNPAPAPIAATAPATVQVDPSNAPAGRDVYYILIDAYTRQDVLASELGIDNSDFVRQLQELGFIVDSCAQSNYDNTVFSLTSSLNMNYLDALGIPSHPDATEEQYDDFVPQLKHSQVRQEFAAMGYQFVTFKAIYPWIDITDSDIYYDAEAATPMLDRQEAINFQYLFLRNTALRPLLEYLDTSPDRLAELPSYLLNFVDPQNPLFALKDYGQYVQNEFAFDTLETLAQVPGKKFVYAHLFPVHQPYVYREDGGYHPATAIEGAQDYANAISHTNERILTIVKKLIEDSQVPPVIILQGDHGKPVTDLRVRQLNALYLPDGGAGAFYAGMTPVNTFRLILDYYFGQHNGLLPDQSYHSPYQTPYQLEPVPGSCGAS